MREPSVHAVTTAKWNHSYHAVIRCGGSSGTACKHHTVICVCRNSRCLIESTACAHTHILAWSRAASAAKLLMCVCVCLSLLFIYLDIKLFIFSFIHAQPLNFDHPRKGLKLRSVVLACSCFKVSMTQRHL